MDEPIDINSGDPLAPPGAEAPMPSRPRITRAAPDLPERLTAALAPQIAGADVRNRGSDPGAVLADAKAAAPFAAFDPRVTQAQWPPLPLPVGAVAALLTRMDQQPAATTVADADWTSGLGDLLDGEAATGAVPIPAPEAERIVATRAAPAVMAAIGVPSATSPFAIRPRDVGWRSPPASSAMAPVAGHAGMGDTGEQAASVIAQPQAAGSGGAKPAAQQAGRRGLGTVLRKIVRMAAIALVVWFIAMLAAIAAFRFVDPPGSMLMLAQRLGGTEIDQRWVRLRDISPNVTRAVIVSEDGRFCTHWGIDPQEMAAAIERARDGVPRGASTITMQVAKNLFLWPSKSYVRKALELPLTLAIEAMWSKSRILEVYLNIAEWGPGVFGVEAAARHHYAKSAAKLSEQEAALLAVALPNPIQRDAGDPGFGTRRLARAIQARMRSAGRSAACIER